MEQRECSPRTSLMPHSTPGFKTHASAACSGALHSSMAARLASTRSARAPIAPARPAAYALGLGTRPPRQPSHCASRASTDFGLRQARTGVVGSKQGEAVRAPSATCTATCRTRWQPWHLKHVLDQLPRAFLCDVAGGCHARKSASHRASRHWTCTRNETIVRCTLMERNVRSRLRMATISLRKDTRRLPSMASAVRL